MIYTHEYAYWNLRLAYNGIPRELTPIYIDLKMKKTPVSTETLIESLHPDEVSEIVMQHVTFREENAYIGEQTMCDLVTHLSTRMDYYNKLKLVDGGFAYLAWDSERGEPLFIPTESNDLSGGSI